MMPPASPLPVAELSPISRQSNPHLDLAAVGTDACRELHLTLRPLPQESPRDTVRRLAQLLREHGARVARQEVFGSLAAREEVLGSLRRELGELRWPVSYLEGNSCATTPLAGLHVLAVAGAPVEPVWLDGRIVGCLFSDRWARHLLLGDLRPERLDQPRPAQARQAFALIETGLKAGGMGLRNLARTWLFIEDILSWYGLFNDVRTQFFRERRIFEGVVPASTGVRGRNAAGAAVLAGAWAAQPADGAFTLREVKSPRQCPAPNYGSSFSRAVELGTPDLRRLLVSGTASIAPDGRSVCPDDIEAQIDLTMEVVRAILVSRRMDFPDCSRVTAYFKRPADALFFEAWRARQGLEQWPVVCVAADICRDELLFELELDALSTTPMPPPA